ncbi:MAG: Minf_1886 family protein [Gemmatimonadales bacterium]
MHDLQFSTDVLNRIRARGDGYHERAYFFMLAAIEYLQNQFEVRRHVTGHELSWACRDFAVKQFGLLAAPVLGYWGIHRTDDFGRIVYNLVSVGLLSTQPGDRESDFAAVYDFAEAFAEPYAWEGVAGLAGAKGC